MFEREVVYETLQVPGELVCNGLFGGHKSWRTLRLIINLIPSIRGRPFRLPLPWDMRHFGGA